MNGMPEKVLVTLLLLVGLNAWSVSQLEQTIETKSLPVVYTIDMK